MTRHYYTMEEGSRKGPYTEKELEDMLQSEQISLDTKISSEGNGNWMKYAGIKTASVPDPGFILGILPEHQKKAKEKGAVSVKTLSIVLIVLLAGVCSLMLAHALILHFAAEALSGNDFGRMVYWFGFEKKVVDTRIAFIGAAAVVYLYWVFRVSRNAGAIAVNPFFFEAKLNVFSYFLPMLNLIIPPFALSSILSASRNPRAYRYSIFNFLIMAWWLVFLTAVFLFHSISSGNNSLAEQHASRMDVYMGLWNRMIMCNVIWAITLFMLIMIIHAVCIAQEKLIMSRTQK